MKSWALGCVLVVALGGAACTKPNPVVCCTSPSDCSSIGIMEEQRACSSEFVCVDHQCTDPPPGCTSDNDCSGSTPHCASDGTCVECLMSEQCPMNEPVCDAGHACRGCTADSECASAVCNVGVGTCLDESAILYASPSGPDTATCTKAAPCSITHAFALANASKQDIVLAPGSYTASITLDGKTAIVHGAGATVTAASIEAFYVMSGRLRLIGVKVVKLNTGAALTCDPTTPSQIELDEVSVDSGGFAIFVRRCDAVITRSVVKSRTPGYQVLTAISPATVTIDRSRLEGGAGIQDVGASVKVTNSVLLNLNGVDGVATGGGLTTLSFCTLINSPLICQDGMPRWQSTGTPVRGICVDNSLVFDGRAGAPANTSTGSACIVNYSLIYPQSTSPTGSNNKLGMNPALKDVANGDYHLTTASPAVDSADPSATLNIDFDGIARPQGTRRDIGAFEIKP